MDPTTGKMVTAPAYGGTAAPDLPPPAVDRGVHDAAGRGAGGDQRLDGALSSADLPLAWRGTMFRAKRGAVRPRARRA